MCLFLEPMTFGEAKSTDSRTMGFWTDGRNFEKTIFQNPLPQIKSTKGEGENAHAVSPGRTESLPAVILKKITQRSRL